MENLTHHSSVQPQTHPPLVFGQRLRTVTIISFIAALLFVGIFFASLSKLSQPHVTLQPSPSPTTATSPAPGRTGWYIPPTGDRANWKTYRNETFGYSVKIPNDWEILNSLSNNSIIVFEPKPQPGTTTTSISPSISILATTKKRGLSLKNFAANSYYGDSSKFEYKKLNNYETIYVNYPKSSISYFLENATTFYQLTLSNPSGEFKIIFDQILSTFRFLN